MGVLHPRHGAAAKHHLVLRQRARLVGEDVLHLAEVLGDVESSALQVGVGLLVVQLDVLMDEVHLADLDDLNRHKQGDGYQHLEEGRRTESSSAPFSGDSDRHFRYHTLWNSDDFTGELRTSINVLGSAEKPLTATDCRQSPL